MRKSILAGLAMLLVACGGDKATGPETVGGNYTLRTVNGASLPAVFYQDNEEKDEFLGGNITLVSDNSWTGNLSIRATSLPSNVVFLSGSFPFSGSYSLNNGAITLNDAAHGLSLTGSVGGGQLSVAADLGDVALTSLVFHK
jgi:hypothetical protein